RRRAGTSPGRSVSTYVPAQPRSWTCPIPTIPSATPLRRGTRTASTVRRASLRTRATPHSGNSQNHAGAGGGVGRLVDEDEAAGGAVATVLVVEEGLGGAQGDAADLVESQAVGGLVAVQRVDVEAVLEILDHGAGGAGG